MIYLSVFKLPRFVPEFFPQAVIMRANETPQRHSSRETFKIYEDWSPILSGFEEESRSLVLDPPHAEDTYRVFQDLRS